MSTLLGHAMLSSLYRCMSHIPASTRLDHPEVSLSSSECESLLDLPGVILGSIRSAIMLGTSALWSVTRRLMFLRFHCHSHRLDGRYRFRQVTAQKHIPLALIRISNRKIHRIRTPVNKAQPSYHRCRLPRSRRDSSRYARVQGDRLPLRCRQSVETGRSHP
jgi:hypothetical protein